MILEEFGVTDSQASTYTAWYNTVITSGLAGDLIWYVIPYRVGLERSLRPSLGKLARTSPPAVLLMTAMR